MSRWLVGLQQVARSPESSQIKGHNKQQYLKTNLLRVIKIKNTGNIANLALHLLFWGILIFMLLFRDFQLHSRAKNYGYAYMFLGFATHMLLVLGLFYFNYFSITPKYFRTRRFKKFALYILLVWILGIVVMSLDSYLWHWGLDFKLGKRDRPWTNRIWGNKLIASTFVVFFYLWSSTQIRIMLDWFRNAEVQKDLENQKLKAELSMLKLQISPHFLFNTLNNIYSLAFQQRAQAPEAILKLSEIMRYMLYETNADQVSLQREITHIENFITLHKLRLRKTEVLFHIEGDYQGKQIAPMLMLPLVENAFKYGVSTKEATNICFNLSVVDNKLSFRTENRIFKQMEPTRQEEGGIGLRNTRKRLDFLYPDKHQFATRSKNGVFVAELEVALD